MKRITTRQATTVKIQLLWLFYKVNFETEQSCKDSANFFLFISSQKKKQHIIRTTLPHGIVILIYYIRILNELYDENRISQQELHACFYFDYYCCLLCYVKFSFYCLTVHVVPELTDSLSIFIYTFVFRFCFR